MSPIIALILAVLACPASRFVCGVFVFYVCVSGNPRSSGLPGASHLRGKPPLFMLRRGRECELLSNFTVAAAAEQEGGGVGTFQGISISAELLVLVHICTWCDIIGMLCTEYYLEYGTNAPMLTLCQWGLTAPLPCAGANGAGFAFGTARPAGVTFPIFCSGRGAAEPHHMPCQIYSTTVDTWYIAVKIRPGAINQFPTPNIILS